MQAAIVGTGFIGRVHARALRLLGVPLAGVIASTPERSAAAAANLGAQQHYGTTAELIEDPNVSVVHICTPNHLHAPLAALALEAGKHVVCEKPLGLTTSEAADLAERAHASGLVAAVAYAYRYHPMVVEARELVASGDLGAIHLLHGSYLQDWLLYDSDGSWRVDARRGGESRAFADIGSHWCDLAEWVTGQRISELVAITDTVVPRRPATGAQTFSSGIGSVAAGVMEDVSTEDVASVLFKTAEGAVGSLTVSQVSAGRKNRLWLEIDGADGSAVFDGENPESLWVGGRAAAESMVRGAESNSEAAKRVSRLPPGHPQGYLDCFESLFADVYAATEGRGDVTFPTFNDGLRAANLIDAVLRSARESAWVKVRS